MRSLYKTCSLILALLCLSAISAFGQGSDCTSFVDPLISDPFEDDPCCGAFISDNVCYDILGLPPCDDSGSIVLLEFTHPGGTWSGSFLGTGDAVAAHMTSIVAGGATFVYDAATATICAEDVEDANFGDLKFKDCLVGSEIVYSPEVETTNTCPVITPTAEDMLSDGLPNDLQVFTGITTQDFMQNYDGSLGGPTENQVGNMINAVVNSGVFQNGLGCAEYNVNCAEADILASIYTEDFAATLEEMIIDNGEELGFAVPEGATLEDIQTMLESNLQSTFDGFGADGIAGFLNTSLGINFPTTACDDPPQPLQGSSNDSGAKPSGSGLIKSVTTPEVGTAADFDFLDEELPGIGAGGEISTPSPSAMQMIENIQSGVNLYNGAQSSGIPLHTLVANDISVPISLNTSNNGLKVNELGSIVGQHWNLNAAGMVSRVVKGLPDDYSGTAEGMGIGRIQRLRPRIDIPTNIGISFNVPGSEVSDRCLTPRQQIENGVTTSNAAIVKVRWIPTSPNFVNINVYLPVFNFLGVSVEIVFGFSVGVVPDYQLGNVIYEEEGLGLLHAGDASAMQTFAQLPPLSDNYLDGMSEDQQLEYLQLIHPVIQSSDGRYLNTIFNTFLNWSEALNDLFGEAPTYTTQRLDVEADEFYFSAGPYSGKFSFNLAGDPIIYPYMPGVEVDYTTNGNGELTTFTISTPDGLDYTYGNVDGVTNIDRTSNTNYSLPNYYTYPEENLGRTEFSRAAIDIGVLHQTTFIGATKVVTYGETYNRNFKIMNSPAYASAWHLVSIKSNITQEEVAFNYLPKTVSYYSDRSYSHSFPNFGISGGKLKTEYDLINGHLNPGHVAQTKWQNGRADFTYHATETSLDRWDLDYIQNNRGERVAFEYGTERGEIYEDHLLDKIKVYRGGELYKGWHLGYEVSEENLSYNCDGYDVNGPAPISTNPGQETVFNLGLPYDVQWFEYNLYTGVNLDFGCFRTFWRIPIPFGIIPKDKGYRESMGEFSALVEVKGLPDPFDEEVFSLDLTREQGIFSAEHNRSFLSSVQIIDQGNTSHPEFINAITYYDGDIPKRFSTQQDLFGYCTSNVSGSPLPAVSYTPAVGAGTINTAFTEGLQQHFSFYNAEHGSGAFRLGQQEAGMLGFAQRGALKSIEMATGASIAYSYELNAFPVGYNVHSHDVGSAPGNFGAGIRVARKVEDPGDTPPRTTSYSYFNPSFINAPIRYWQKPTNHYYPAIEQRVVSTSSYQNMLLPNKGGFIGYALVKEEWDGIGQTIHHFSTPDNYLDWADKLQISLDPSATESFNCSVETVTLFGTEIIPSNEAICAENIDPALNIEDVQKFCDVFFGLEMTTEVKDASGNNVSTNDYFYGTYDGRGITSEQKQFRSVMNQTNEPGTFLESYAFRRVKNYVPEVNTENGELLLNFLLSLIFDIGTNDLPKSIKRHYQSTTRLLPVCNIRLESQVARNYFAEGSSSNSIITDMMYFDEAPPTLDDINTTALDLDGRENLVARSTSISSDGIQTTTDYRYAFLNESGAVDPTVSTYFDGDAILHLNEYNFLQPIHSKTWTNGILTNHSFSALSLLSTTDGGKIVPKADYGLQNGNLRLRGKYTAYNDEGTRPIAYYKAKYLATYDSPQEDFLDVINLEWTDQLQLASKTYTVGATGPSDGFKTTYRYTGFFEYAGQTDINGVHSSYGYDTKARLISISEDGGLRNTTFEYNIEPGNNSLASTVAIAGQTPQNSVQNVDGFGKVKSVIRMNDGAVMSTATYDEFWRATETSSLRSGVVLNTYEASPASRLLETLDEEDNLVLYEYAGGGEGGNFFYQTAVTDPNGYTTNQFYNSLEQIIGLQQPEGALTTYSYDHLLRLTTITNPIGEVYTYSYNDMGRLYRKTVPVGGAKRYWYDEKYRMVASADNNGNELIYEYDGFDRMVRSYLNHPGVALGGDGIVPDYAAMVSSYEEDFLLSQQEYVADYSLYLNNKQDLILTADDDRNFVDTRFHILDVLGRPIDATSTYPDGTVNSITSYDGLGNILSTTDKITHAGQELTVSNIFGYDEVIRPSRHWVGAGELGVEVNRLIYDARDRLVVKLVGDIADSEETLQQVDYYYDKIGRIVAINSFGGYECNVGEQICQQSLEISLTNKQLTNLQCVEIATVNISGLVYEPTDNFTGNTPEEFGDYIVEVLEDALHVLGHIGAITQTHELTEDGFTFLFTIDNTDALDIRLQFENCDDVFSFELGECCEVLPSGGGTAYGENYNLTGGVGGRNPDLYYQSMEYDGLDMSQIEIGSECFYGRMINNYTYDGLHRVTAMDNILFTPDPIGQAFSTVYSYDPAGNIQTLKRNGFVGLNQQGEPQFGLIDDLVYDYPTQDSKLASIEDVVSNPDHQAYGFELPQAGYGYDGNGNMLGNGVIDYNLLNLPQEMEAGGISVYQDYVSSGQKYKKRTLSEEPETRFYLGGVEWVEGLPQTYNFGDGRIYWEEEDQLTGEQEIHIQYRLTDHLGNSMVFFEDKNADGLLITELDSPADPEDLEVIQRLWYYPFGMHMEGIGQQEATPYQPFRYNGKDLEQTVGLYEYGFRYYDAAIGRFTGVDPIADQFAFVSPFNYAENEPVNNRDLWGLQKGGNEFDNPPFCGCNEPGRQSQGIVQPETSTVYTIVPKPVIDVLEDIFQSGWGMKVIEKPKAETEPKTTSPRRGAPVADEGGDRTIFRGMRRDENGLPLTGESARTLGVRKSVDIPVDENGMVYPFTGGMSVAPDTPSNLPRHRRPAGYGGTGKDPVWELQVEQLPAGLYFLQDSPTHGLIMPGLPMSYDTYKTLLEKTQVLWVDKGGDQQSM